MKIKRIIQRIKESGEFKSYILWGGLSAILNVVLFRVLTIAGLEYRVSNIITLLIVRLFCFLTNKFFVFKTKSKNFISLLKEIVVFLFAKMITFCMDYFGLILLVEVLEIDLLICKIFTSVLVIICNYIFSKFFVFKKKREIL